MRTSQVMTPAFHPLPWASATQEASVAVSMKPLLASAAAAGLPITILLRSIPALAISKTEVPGNVPPEVVRRPVPSVYSDAPWL